MDTNHLHTQTRQAAINGLAVVGFIALVAAGIWLAVYSTRFVPVVVNNLGAAAVYLGQVFNRGDDPTLSVVPTPSASTTIPFDTATTSTDTAPTPTPSPSKPVATSAGTKTSGTYPISGTAPAVLSGLPDLTITVSALGYLTTTSADSFVAASSVPDGERPAITFTVKNIGANWSGTWRFKASLPTRTSFTFESQPQQSLAPGDSIDYTLGFDRADAGTAQPISVVVNSDNTVTESNTNNNRISLTITILD